MNEKSEIDNEIVDHITNADLKSLRIRNLKKIVVGHLNINSIKNKFDFLAHQVNGNIDIVMISETKLDESFPKSNLEIALNVLYAEKENKCPCYISKYNSNHQKQVILIIILNGERWHYLAVKKLSALLRGIMSKHHVDFYYFNCLHSFETENKSESRTNYLKINFFVTL